MYYNAKGFYKCKEKNFVKKVCLLYLNRNKLNPIKKDTKNFMAASIFFMKEIGYEMQTFFLGKHQIKKESK